MVTLLLAGAVLAGLGLWWVSRPQPAPVEAARATPAVRAGVGGGSQARSDGPGPIPGAQPPPAVSAAPTGQTASGPAAPLDTVETRATDRMIAAHAPLRAPAVADPDSPENRVILQTMLSKALTRKDALPQK